MPRFKTVVHVRCENGHTNLFEIRTQADSSDIARAYTEGDAAFRRCRYCKTTELMALVQMFPTKEVSLPMGSTIWGYTCDCGEKVEVAREVFQGPLSCDSKARVSIAGALVGRDEL